ncbi:MAG: HpcH/HpaI aldolase/citrate lyase family protein, partial [Rhodothalassiaceae bacterium]
QMEAFGAAPEMRLWAMMETSRAVLGADAIGRASRRLAGFVMGTNDLAKELRAAHVPGRAPLLTSLSLVVLAARAHGLAALDSVYADFRDTAGFEVECRQAVAFGFDGKTLIHPSQIAIANRAFRPSPQAVAEARRICDAWRKAAAEGRGVAVLDGRMIERLHAEEAERLLALDAAIAARPGPDAVS